MNQMKKIFLILCICGCIFLSYIHTSWAFDGFYTFSNQNIEFRLARKVDQLFPNEENWPIKADMKGNKFYISPEVCISKNDIEGILVEPLTEKEKSSPIAVDGKVEQIANYPLDNPNKVIIYFKKDSWPKIRNLTEHGFPYNIAIIRNGIILACPAIMDKFDKEIKITILDLKAMKLLLKGLQNGNEPLAEKRDKEYEKWLTGNIQKNIGYARDLNYIASDYVKTGNYQDAASIFELILNYYPLLIEDYYQLGDCYYKQKKYDQAIHIFEKGISLKPDFDFVLILKMYIGDCYIAQEKYSLARDQYRLCLEKAKAHNEDEFLLQLLEKTLADLEAK
jgi:Uncharacterized protein conserved in bacteria